MVCGRDKSAINCLISFQRVATLHNFFKESWRGMRMQGLYHTVSVAQRHIALFQEWNADLHFVEHCSGAVCTGFTSLRWRKASYSQTDDLERVSQQQLYLSVLPPSLWLDYVHYSSFLKKLLFQGSQKNLFFGCDSRGSGQIEDLREKW